MSMLSVSSSDSLYEILTRDSINNDGDKNSPFSNDFTVERILGDPVLIRQWGIKGLPADSLSIENGIIVN